MALGVTDPELIWVRTTVVSLALQALVGRLSVNGVFDKGDLVAMRELGLQFAADMQERPGMEAAGALIGAEVENWWKVAEELG